MVENAPVIAPIDASDGTGATASGSAAWRRYNQLASAGEDLLDQARATQTELPDKDVDDTASLDTTEEQPLDGEQEPQTELPVRTVALTLTTNPAGVRVYVEGVYVGRSPLEYTISSAADSVEIMLRKTDFDTHRFQLTMLEPIAQQQVTLNPTNPFGRTSTMGGRNR